MVRSIYQSYPGNVGKYSITPPGGDSSAGFYIKIYIFNWSLIDSGLKLLLYGTRFRIIQSCPGNIGNWSLQHSPESWKYWKTDFVDSVLSWKYWKTEFLEFLISRKYWKSDFSNFLLSWKYWIARSIYQPYPGNIGSYDPYINPILEIVDRTIHVLILSWK